MRINCKYVIVKEREMMGLTNSKVKTMKNTEAKKGRNEQRRLRSNHQNPREERAPRSDLWKYRAQRDNT